jgi:hypothetical protein
MASGDLKFREDVTGTLTGAQRTSLANLLNAPWPGVLSDLTDVRFFRNPDNTVGYRLEGERTAAPAQVPLGVRIVDRIP